LRSRCFWPTQYGKSLREARIVYATQAHLERSASFLLNLRNWAGTDRMLTLLDESHFVGTSFERMISLDDLRRFNLVLRDATAFCDKPSWQHSRWQELTSMLLDASTVDLQDAGWRIPAVNPQWAAIVQSAGLKRFGDDFRFLGYDLNQFNFSALESRHKTAN